MKEIMQIIFDVAPPIVAVIMPLVIWRWKRGVDKYLASQIESYKAELQVQTAREQKKYAVMQTRRAEVLDAMFKKLHVAIGIIRGLTMDTASGLKGPDLVEIRKKVCECMDHFEIHRHYLPFSICEDIETAYKKMLGAFVACGNTQRLHSACDSTRQKALESDTE